MRIESVITALKEIPWGSVLMVAGDLNENLEQHEGDQRDEEIAAMLPVAVLEEM